MIMLDEPRVHLLPENRRAFTLEYHSMVSYESPFTSRGLRGHSQSGGSGQEPVRVALRHEAKEAVQLRGHGPERTRGVFSAIRRGLSQAENEADVPASCAAAEGNTRTDS